MCRLSIKLFVFALAVATSVAGWPAPVGPASAGATTVPAASDLAALLRASHFAELDQRLSERQRAYETGSITEEDLRDAFRAFYPTDADLSVKYDSWIQAFPKSYVARLARGIYLQKVGEEQRGGDTIDRTTGQQIQNMTLTLTKALDDLKVSVRLTAKPILSYVRAIDIARALGAPDGGRQFLERAVAIDPHTYLARARYMVGRQTRWGGSLEEMQAFFKDCKRAGLSKPHLNLIESLVVEEEGWSHLHGDGDVAAARSAYTRAKSLNPDLCMRCFYEESIGLLMQRQQFNEAIAMLSELLAQNPADAFALDTRGAAYMQTNQPRLAFADWTKSAAGGSAYAQGRLGGLYMNGVPGLLERNFDTAIGWYRKAAATGDPVQRRNLARALEYISARRPGESSGPGPG